MNNFLEIKQWFISNVEYNKIVPYVLDIDKQLNSEEMLMLKGRLINLVTHHFASNNWVMHNIRGSDSVLNNFGLLVEEKWRKKADAIRRSHNRKTIKIKRFRKSCALSKDAFDKSQLVHLMTKEYVFLLPMDEAIPIARHDYDIDVEWEFQESYILYKTKKNSLPLRYDYKPLELMINESIKNVIFEYYELSKQLEENI